MESITLTNAHGTFTCNGYQLDREIRRQLPASVNDLRGTMKDVSYPATEEYADIHSVGEFLIMLAATPEAPAVAARQPHAYNDDGSDPGNCSVCHFYHR